MPAPELPRTQARLVVPEKQAYVGAYIDFGPTEDDVTFEALVDFERLVGRHQAVVGFSNFWGKQAFPKQALAVVSGYGAIPLIYWNPWDHPFEQDNLPDKFNVQAIADGVWDSYIDAWGEAAKEYGEPMLVAWGLEMNGRWFPWSGFFYNGKKEPPRNGPAPGPELFKKAYRRVVDRVRAKGATNIAWVFHANNTSEPNVPWNQMERYYPGSDYVDWLGLSAYGKQYPDPGWSKFEDVLPKYYRQIMALAPEKPFILAEWGIGEFPKQGDKAAWITEALDRMQKEFPQLKAQVFWHERWQNGDLSYSNLRVNSSEQALRAFRAGIGSPFWLDRPIFAPRTGTP